LNLKWKANCFRYRNSFNFLLRAAREETKRKSKVSVVEHVELWQQFRNSELPGGGHLEGEMEREFPLEYNVKLAPKLSRKQWAECSTNFRRKFRLHVVSVKDHQDDFFIFKKQVLIDLVNSWENQLETNTSLHPSNHWDEFPEFHHFERLVNERFRWKANKSLWILKFQETPFHFDSQLKIKSNFPVQNLTEMDRLNDKMRLFTLKSRKWNHLI
jgi:hypothetical protein